VKILLALLPICAALNCAAQLSPNEQTQIRSEVFLKLINDRERHQTNRWPHQVFTSQYQKKFKGRGVQAQSQINAAVKQAITEAAAFPGSPDAH
jgi:hypothetical protein